MISLVVKGRKISHEPNILLQWNNHTNVEARGMKISCDPIIRLHLCKDKKNRNQLNEARKERGKELE